MFRVENDQYESIQKYLWYNPGTYVRKQGKPWSECATY